MDYIKVVDIKISNNRVEVEYLVSECLSQFFDARTFILEYDEDISEVPQSILVIPFLCDVLPVAWVTNSRIELDVLDEDFYSSIDEFKKGYIKMYPTVHFGGDIKVKTLEKNTMEGNESALFFSGGVDAYSSLIAHVEERPRLITLWGSDVKLNDLQGWNVVKTAIQKVGEEFVLPISFVKTNFRDIVNTTTTTELIKHTGEEWWHGFQHGIGIISHIAPLAYLHKIKKTYIASTFTKDLPNTCASDPTIDNYIKFCGSEVIHDQYDFSRQMKVASICRYAQSMNKSIPLHVCWISDGGTNCCCCEKCYRTICAIYAANDDPNKYGFCVGKSTLKEMYFNIHHTLYFVNITIVFWKEIQDAFKKNFPNGHPVKELNWIYNFDFDKVNEKKPIPEPLHIRIRHILGRFRRRIFE